MRVIGMTERLPFPRIFSDDQGGSAVLGQEAMNRVEPMEV